jgi:Flp pilus assembly protein TadB
MPHEITDPSEQNRIIADFARKSEAEKKQRAQFQLARQGPPWMWVCFAVLVWGQIMAMAMIDWAQPKRVLIVAAFVVFEVLYARVFGSVLARSRERVLLEIASPQGRMSPGLSAVINCHPGAGALPSTTTRA